MREPGCGEVHEIYAGDEKDKRSYGDKGIDSNRITFDGKPAIIAAEVKKGDEVLKLRDEEGVPAWGGRGRRGKK